MQHVDGDIAPDSASAGATLPNTLTCIHVWPPMQTLLFLAVLLWEPVLLKLR